MDDHGIRVGDIQSRFDDRCGYKDIDITVNKVQHDPLQLTLIHLTVGKCHLSLRNK